MKVLVDLDDVHPEKCCTGDMDNGVFKYADMLASSFPKIKMMLFVTPNWIQKSRLPFHKLSRNIKASRRWPEGKFRLDRYPEWCRWLSGKVRTGNFQLGVHGLHHIQENYPYSAEFTDLSYEETRRKIEWAERIFRSAKLRFVKVFRPPGWGVNDALLRVLKEKKYIIAGACDFLTPVSRKAKTNGSGIKGASLIYEDRFMGVRTLTANCNIKDCGFERIRQIADLNGVVLLHGHVENRYGFSKISNGLKESYGNLRYLLEKIEKEYGNKCFSRFPV